MKFSSTLVLISAFLCLLASCEKDDLRQDVDRDKPFDPTWKQGDSVPIVSRHYFRAKIDSQVYVLQDGQQSYVTFYDSVKYGICDGDSGINFMGFATQLRHGGNENHSIIIRFLSCIEDGASSAMNAATIYKGGYPFGSIEIGNRSPGVLVSWIDGSGTTWSSRPGTGAAHNFRFQLTEPLSEESGYGVPYYIEGVMDLRLYHGSQSIRLEGGEFRMKMSKI